MAACLLQSFHVALLGDLGRRAGAGRKLQPVQSAGSRTRRTPVRSLAWFAGAVLGSLVLAGAATWSGPKSTESSDRAAAAVRAMALSELPPEARQTMELVRQGGPFPYQKDGTVFFNRERLLPAQARGHYREYTVPTPGEGDRGARRLVCGGEPVTSPEVCYYTADHYRSFKRLQP